MINKILYWTAGLCASLALVLSVADMALVKGNQSIQEQVNQRQSIINTASRISPLTKQLSQALFEMAVKENDPKIKTLLTSQGFVLPELPARKEMDKAPASKKGEAPEPKKMNKENVED